MGCEPERWVVFPMGYEPGMRFLDRSSHATRHPRAAAGVFGRRRRRRPHPKGQRGGSLQPYHERPQAVQVSAAEQSPPRLIRYYLRRVTGYSRPQLSRLIAQDLHSGRLVQRYRATTTSYARKFTPEDIVLLAELDSLHGTLSGPATRVLLQRAFHRFGQASYERLATIS